MRDRGGKLTYLVTGGAGFIGSTAVRLLLGTTPHRIVTLDALTYAGNLESLGSALADPRHRFVHSDVCDRARLLELLLEERPDAVLHLAAESHVDRSIDGPSAFIRTNVVGTESLLEAVRAYLSSGDAPERFRFVHVSTDEVFGSLGPEAPPFTVSSSYAPSSPYAASKAAADHLARAWARTYRLPVIVTNCSNNYGPYQFPEKLIPLTITNAVEGRRLPVYGDGSNVRDWLFVEDHARGLQLALERGEPGETYLFGGGAERTNLDVVLAICELVDEMRGIADGRPARERIEFVADRPGHDLRYAVDASHAARTLGWAPSESFQSGLRRTVRWYLETSQWSERVRNGKYRQERLGLGASA